MFRNQPAQIIPKPGETDPGLREALRRHPIKAGGHMSTMIAAEPADMAVARIERGPERSFIIDMLRQCQCEEILRNSVSRSCEGTKVVDGHDGIDGSDHRRRATEAADNRLEARVG